MRAPSSDSPKLPHPERRTRDTFRQWFNIRRHPFVVSLEIAFFILLLGGGVRRWSTPVIVLQADGKAQTLRVHGKTVSDVLALQKIVVNPEDLCLPPPTTPLQRHMTIKVVRVKHPLQTRVEKSPPQISDHLRLKTNLRPVLVEKGVIRETTKKVVKTFHDGEEVDEKVLSTKTVKHPFYKLTLFNKKGYPVKTYDLTKCKMLKMRATGYYVGEKYVPSDTTYLGYKLERGLVAVDPAVIPLGSRLYVKGYGYAYAADTGSAIKGLRIDLAVKDKYEEAKFNRYDVPVYILEKSKTW